MSASTLAGLIEVALQSQRGAFSGIVAVDAIEVENSAMPAALRVRTAHLTMQSRLCICHSISFTVQMRV
jgi:hypothetical protein